MENKKGISLIILVITIIVLAILVVSVIGGATLAVNNAKMVTFADELAAIEENILSTITLGAELPLENAQYTKAQLLSLASRQQDLSSEINTNTDNNSKFRIVDLKKLGANKATYGSRKNGTSDIYAVSLSTYNVYYVEGLKVGADRYHSLTKKLIDTTKIDNPILNINIGAVGINTAEEIKVVKNTNEFTNRLVLTVNTLKLDGYHYFIKIGGKEAEVNLEKGNYILNVNASFTQRDLQNQTSAIVFKKNTSNIILASDTVDISNLDVTPPVLTADNIVVTFKEDTMLASINASDDRSGVDTYFYDTLYIEKEPGVMCEASNNNISDYYTTNNLADENIKKHLIATAKKDKSNMLAIPKNALRYRIIVQDKAGNVSNFADKPARELVTPPTVLEGMVPFRYGDANNIIDITSPDFTKKSWHNYTNKEWANARTQDGSMWVWIPRFAYRIVYKDAGGTVIGYSDNRGYVNASGVENKNIDKSKGTVEAVFLGTKDSKYSYISGNIYGKDVRSKDAAKNPNHYVIHPAFTNVRRDAYTTRENENFGWNVEIPGFWISKFEMTKNADRYCSLPGIRDRSEINANDIYDQGRIIVNKNNIKKAESMNVTNTQWGAATYLSLARGNTAKIAPNGAMYTGGGTGNAYITNVAQSTTGNITGVYDMSGCRWEYSSALVMYKERDLDQMLANSMIINTDSKFVDSYISTDSDGETANRAANIDAYGDATLETLGWFNGYASFPNYTYGKLFIRGGVGASLPGITAYATANGRMNPDFTWRGVIIEK
ncbi:MAG: hypothetical protein RR751_06945 [Clostridia bacterium]